MLFEVPQACLVSASHSRRGKRDLSTTSTNSNCWTISPILPDWKEQHFCCVC